MDVPRRLHLLIVGRELFVYGLGLQGDCFVVAVNVVDGILETSGGGFELLEEGFQVLKGVDHLGCSVANEGGLLVKFLLELDYEGWDNGDPLVAISSAAAILSCRSDR